MISTLLKDIALVIHTDNTDFVLKTRTGNRAAG